MPRWTAAGEAVFAFGAPVLRVSLASTLVSILVAGFLATGEISVGVGGHLIPVEFQNSLPPFSMNHSFSAKVLPEPALTSHSAPSRRARAFDVSASFSLSASDRSLVDAIRAGDSLAAAPLYHALRPTIEQALQRVLRGKPADFEDLMQITFERVVRTIAENRFEGRSRLSTWAYAIAVHVAMDWMRSCATERSLLEAVHARALEQGAYETHTERQLEARSEVRRIATVLGRMKRMKAVTLLLHDVHDHSMPEVAELLGISVSAAESRLRRARVELLRFRTKRVPRSASTACSGAPA